MQRHCHGYRGSTPQRSAATGKEVLGLLPGPSAQDPVPEVWHHVNSIRGNSRRQLCDPDSAGRAGELVLQWKEASSFSGLPVEHQEALDQQRP
ncbi:hypothetical protein E2C01_072137 [Portunus trituberculatus]|uniref:Uncharacterized protein n=1 Tax=Portunus trituberculatus TaxID=210409 RepID=A0A5B7I9X7_PORTR|nr:hypothetical protein [Portunus trituberculatus]